MSDSWGCREDYSLCERHGQQCQHLAWGAQGRRVCQDHRHLQVCLQLGASQTMQLPVFLTMTSSKFAESAARNRSNIALETCVKLERVS